MSWGEAIRLMEVVSADPTSALAASLNGWKHPASREALVLMDLFDAFTKANFKRPKPYPRPWDAGPRKFGRTKLPRDEVVAILNAHGHNLN